MPDITIQDLEPGQTVIIAVVQHEEYDDPDDGEEYDDPDDGEEEDIPEPVAKILDLVSNG
jgi:hypothetical protein